MNQKAESVKDLIESLSPSELAGLAGYLRSKLPKHPLEEKWAISSELILDAIHRSQDITQRGVRGVIAEAVFEAEIIPQLRTWRKTDVVGGLPYDFKLQRNSGNRTVTIQVKLQRTEKGAPLVRKAFGPDNFVVEVQKTRTGTKKKVTGNAVPEKTRPYQFGDFDIIAVNMQPSTGDWKRYMYTVGTWLIPRAGNRKLIEIMQPVSHRRSSVWTDNLEECIQWFLSGEKKCVFDVKAALRKKAAERQRRRAAR
jgi:hypothetical protein